MQSAIQRTELYRYTGDLGLDGMNKNLPYFVVGNLATLAVTNVQCLFEVKKFRIHTLLDIYSQQNHV